MTNRTTGASTRIERIFNGGDLEKLRHDEFDVFAESYRLHRVILPRLMREFPWIGTRPAAESDFYSFCDHEEIRVVMDPQIVRGIYAFFLGKSFIFLNSHLEGRQLRHVMFYELAHYLFHGPSASLSKSRKHIEADLVTGLCNSGTIKRQILRKL